MLLSKEIKDVLHSSNRKISFKYDLLDKEDNFIKTLIGIVDSCRVTNSSLGQLKSSASIKMKDSKDINYLTDRIKPYVVFKTKGKEYKFPLGIFLLNSPIKKDEDGTIFRDISCYSKLQILKQDKYEERHFISKGSNYGTAMAQIIASTGETKIKITPTDRVLQTDKEFDINLSKLDIVNKLATEINYYSLNVDMDGYFIANPYILPVDRTVDFEYIDDELSVLYGGASEELDLFNVPNIFIRHVNNPERPDMKSKFINDNPDSPTSTFNRSRNVSMEFVDDIASQSDLDDLTIRDAYNASAVYGYVSFSTAIMPVHSFLNCLYLRYNRLNINSKYIETSWEIDCKAGAMMQHNVRKVVRI